MAVDNNLSARKANLSPAKRILFERRARGEFAERRLQAQVIARRRQHNYLPLSFAQQRLWFLHQLDPASHAYNLRRAVRIRGDLNREAVQKALDALVTRHEALRTNFIVLDGAPVQLIAASRPVTVSHLDLSERHEIISESEIEELLQREAHKPFDLTCDPLLRATLIRLASDEHIFLLVTHHIVTDMWSNSILLREFSLLYESFSLGRPTTLTELPIQYADFALWQREWLQGDVLEKQTAYWKNQLGHDHPPLQLPGARTRPPIQSGRGKRIFWTYPRPLLDDLKALSRREGVTLFMTLLAAFQALLHRYTGRDDINVGTPIANRNRPEIEGVVGFFVNTLVMRTNCAGDPSFRELLRRVRETALGAYAHQDLPFEKLVEELQPERSLSHNPLFNVAVNIPNVRQNPFEIPGLSLTPLDFDTGAAKFDWTIYMEESSDGFWLYFEYNMDLFDDETIARTLGHFETLLEGIVTDPTQPLSVLPILKDDERRQLLLEWNETRTNLPPRKLVHELFERQAERTPDAEAIICENRCLTYRELNQKANQLARLLRKEGVGPESLVGVCLDRSVEMIISLIATLKAGGAYVPLDPAYPAERVAFMLDDARINVLLSQSNLAANLTHAGLRRVNLDVGWGLCSAESSHNLPPLGSDENLAYVIYTSGSTGKPKGVAIEHRNTVAFLDWVGRTYTSAQLKGVLAATSVCFDLSVFEIFGPLCHGGKIILAQNVLDLAKAETAREVTLINTVPSAAVELLRLRSIPDSVMTINLAGETLTQNLVDEIYRQTSVREVFDLYGPSETTTYSTFTLRKPGGSATIGRPIANTQIYILDKHLQPQPVGVPGELYIGGGGVARGYLHRPTLTAEKFIASPFPTSDGRLYRTGDLARYRADGTIEFLGRLDHQVKIRGHRIELGEIEAVLTAHQAVGQAVVIARNDGKAGENDLVAYLTPTTGFVIAESELRDYLGRKLPAYMVPSFFVSLQQFPLGPNGKVNRAALPAPHPVAPQKEEKTVGPRTETEEIISKIWADTLRREQTSVFDNFFQSGGHSLLATQVISRLRDQFQVDLPLRTIFEKPTVEGLAAAVEQQITEIELLLAELEGKSLSD